MNIHVSDKLSQVKDKRIPLRMRIMKICVEEIIPSKLPNTVRFSTEFGNALAFWEGDAPVTNCKYHVEVDINDILVWDKDIIAIKDTGNYSIREENNCVSIIGDLESVDDDGYSIIKFGESIIPFMTTGKPFQVGTFIKITTKSIFLSPVTY